MTIPNSITIKLVNPKREPQPILHVIAILKIFITKDSYHTFSIIATDSFGEIRLTRDEIIANTEIIKQELSGHPTYFEFHLWKEDNLRLMKNQIENLLKSLANPDGVIHQLKSIGVPDSQIENEIKKTKKKELEDRQLLEQLSQSANHRLKPSNHKLSGTWDSDTEQVYELVVELKPEIEK